jgi:hypothetical protein
MVEARQKIADALDAIQEGRKLDDETIKALRDYLENLLEDEEEIEEERKIEESEEEKTETLESGRKISLRLAKAIANNN